MTAERTGMRNDSGETLIEVLVAIVILGIAAVAILGGLQLSVAASDIHRKQTTGGAYARSYAEAVERYVAADPSNYRPCATANAYTPVAVGFGGALPPGFAAT